MLGLQIDMGRWHAPGSSIVSPPSGPAVLPVSPTARWHPQFSSVALNDGRVVSASDLEGLAGVTAGAAGLGPYALVDAAGTKFWRFAGTEYLDVASTLSVPQRDFSVVMVGRVPRVTPTRTVFFGSGNVTAGTQANTSGGTFEAVMHSNSAGYIGSNGRQAYTSTDREWFVPGAQKQVMGMTSEASLISFVMNDHITASSGSGIGGASGTGAEIGRYPQSPGSSGNWGKFDLYEMVVFSPAITASELAAVSAALMNAHDVTAYTNQLVLEGDSIMAGTGAVLAGYSSAAVLTNPGAAFVGADWRVINKGVSGATISNLVTKRDAPNAWVDQTLTGDNVVAIEIGRNDLAFVSTATHYGNLVGYLNTTTTGVLQRGWDVRVMANIATAPGSLQTKIEEFRTLIRDGQFLTDTMSGSGQPYDGKVSIVSTDLIEHDGETRFLHLTDTANTAYYAGDFTHPSILGAEVRVTGGSTPQHGVVVGL